MSHFMDQLASAVEARGNPVLVGLDPRREMLPGKLLDAGERDPRRIADAYLTFCRAVIDVVAAMVPAVKPQAAFFEELGVPGVEALARVIGYARKKGLLVILDGKRNVIGSTAEAYARGLLGELPPAYTGGSPETLAADAVTVSPYLGGESLRPFVDVAVERGCGVFVLVKTSNPGGGMFQDLVADGRPIYLHVAIHVEELARETVGARGYGAVGAVVGATYPEELAGVRAAMPQTWFLVPGYGSQGGTAADVAAAFDGRGLGAIVNSSRAIIFAHRRAEFAARFGDSRWQEAVEAATSEMIAELRAETPAGNLAGFPPNLPPSGERDA